MIEHHRITTTTKINSVELAARRRCEIEGKLMRRKCLKSLNDLMKIYNHDIRELLSRSSLDAFRCDDH